jgi:hypothetical protein
MLVAGSDKDSRVVLWDRATGRRLLDRMAHGSAIKAVAFSPDGKLVISGEEEGLIRSGMRQRAELRAFRRSEADACHRRRFIRRPATGRRAEVGNAPGLGLQYGEKLGETNARSRMGVQGGVQPLMAD